MADSQKGKAWPIADATLTNQVLAIAMLYFGLGLLTKHRIACVLQILDLIQQASQYKQLKKGANEGEAGSTCRFLVVD